MTGAGSGGPRHVQEDDQKRRVTEIHDEQARLFEDRYVDFMRDPYSSAFTYGRYRLELALQKYLPARGDGLRVLDAGCGSGYALRDLAGRGYSCAGLDAAEAMVEAARRHNPGMEIVHGDVEALPWPSESFDFVISIEVIRYLKDAAPTLSEFHRVLKPGGTALVTAMPPYTLTGYPLINLLTSRAQIGGLSRVRQFFHSRKTLENLFLQARFSTIRVHATFWGPWRNIERLAPRLLPALLRRWEPVDEMLERIPAAADFSNHLLAAARK